MTTPILYSIHESPTHPDFSSLYRRLHINELHHSSMRKAISALKTRTPDFIVAEFFYGWGNNYAGVNISNLDVLLFSLQKYAPAAKVIVLVEKAERQYVAKLNDIFPLHAVLVHPVTELQIVPCLSANAP